MILTDCTIEEDFTELFFGLRGILLAPVGGGTGLCGSGRVQVTDDVLPVAVPVLLDGLQQTQVLAEKNTDVEFTSKIVF
jgi:hypothetical protein